MITLHGQSPLQELSALKTVQAVFPFREGKLHCHADDPREARRRQTAKPHPLLKA